MLKVSEALFIQCFYPANTNHHVYIFFIIKNFFTLFMKAKQNLFAVIELGFSVLSHGLCQTSNSAVAYEKNAFTQIERIHLA